MSDGTPTGESATVAEQSVLGSMLMAGNLGTSAITEVAAILEPGDFPGPRHRAIYRAILAHHGEGVPVDVVTIGDRLGDRLDEHGGHAYLMELLQSVPHAAHATYYAGIVRRRAIDRRRRELCQTATATLDDPTASNEDKDAAWDALRAEPVANPKRRAVTLADIWGDIDPRHLPPLRLFPIGAGFEDVGLSPGKVVVIGGPPGLGKTTLTMQWVFDALLDDPTLRAFVVNVEMAPQVLIHRQLARLAQVPFGQIMRRPDTLGKIYGEQLDHGLSVLAELRNRLTFASTTRLPIEEIIAETRRHSLDILVLDYVQKIPTRADRETRERIAEILTHAREIAMTGVCVIAVSAVSRGNSAAGKYKDGGMGSFRDSSDFEYAGDDAWRMVAGDDADADGRTRTVELIGEKIRNDRKPVLALDFEGQFQQFTPDNPHAELSVHTG